jgi:hypothetical protein
VAGALCVNTSSFELDASTVQHNATRGLVLVQSDATITNNTFDDHPEEAVRLHGCNHAVGPCRPTIGGNTFTNNASAILRSSAQDPIMLGNQASNNDANGFVVAIPTIFVGDNTWYADLPYVIPGWCNVGGYGPASLTLEPGTVVKIDGGGLVIKTGTAFTASGTADEPVTFTSVEDDSVGGDTSNDGAASTPGPDDYYDVSVTDAGSRALFEHVVFRYGGGRQAGVGPLVLADWGAELKMRHCELSQGETGVAVWRSATLTLEESVLHDLSNAGVLVDSDGEVLIAGNRFEATGTGVGVAQGHPTVRDSFFQGNAIAVDATCNPLYVADCAPVVSPDNRFVGGGQQGVINRHPTEGCVAAQGNWWGAETGPDDPSSDADACGLVDNPGAGAYSSDGVDYSPWEGGVARPVISWPGCGVTANEQPTFVGRAQDGAAVSIYGDEQLIGAGVCAADHSFSVSTTVPLSDGGHLITAIAELGGATSLPSRPLSLTVDSSLDYDPAGVLITYQFHNVVYTQTLRDASGCATPLGDVSTELQLRPETTMTIHIPLRKSAVVSRTVDLPLREMPAQLGARAAMVSFTIQNNSGKVLRDVYLVPSGSHDGLVEGHQRRLWLGDGESRMVAAPEGFYDVVAIAEDGSVLQLGPVWFATQGAVHTVDPADQASLSLLNAYDEEKISRVFITDQPELTAGPNLLKPGTTELNPKDVLNWTLPKNQYLIMLQLEDGTWRMGSRDITSDKNYRFSDQGPSRPVTIYSSYNLCEVYVKPKGGGEAPNLVQLMGYDQLDAWTEYELKLAPGEYELEAVDCDGKIVDRRTIYPRGYYVWDVGDPCAPPGEVEYGFPGGQVVAALEEAGSTIMYPIDYGFDWLWYQASQYVPEGWMTAPRWVHLELCTKVRRQVVGVGVTLIDPDGYVYDAAVGLEARIEGATVTCDVYDEDLVSWDRWPAEVYQSQINPQITALDGYYAFFVPPGLYRVRAEATGYLSHTSPDIRVISEIVHYNIPLEAVYRVYLPVVVRGD